MGDRRSLSQRYHDNRREDRHDAYRADREADARTLEALRRPPARPSDPSAGMRTATTYSGMPWFLLVSRWQEVHAEVVCLATLESNACDPEHRRQFRNDLSFLRDLDPINQPSKLNFLDLDRIHVMRDSGYPSHRLQMKLSELWRIMLVIDGTPADERD